METFENVITWFVLGVMGAGVVLCAGALAYICIAEQLWGYLTLLIIAMLLAAIDAVYPYHD